MILTGTTTPAYFETFLLPSSLSALFYYCIITSFIVNNTNNKIIRYMPEDTIASHSDDERSMKNQSPIFSLSWGGPRRFVVRPRLKTTPSNKYTSCSCADITLRSGDLVVMGGSLQQTHTHEIPKWRKTKDLYVPTRRINWTVRAFHVQQKESAASNS